MVETEANDNKTSQVTANHSDNINNGVVYHAVYVPRDNENNAEGRNGRYSIKFIHKAQFYPIFEVN